MSASPLPPPLVEPGAAVTILKGGFSGMSAVVAEPWSGEDTVRLTVILFGTPVAIDLRPWECGLESFPREDSWPEGTSLERMLLNAEAHGTSRQLSLFAAACCRRVRYLMSEERCAKLIEERKRYGTREDWGPWSPTFLMEAVELAEWVADGDGSAEELERVSHNAHWLQDVQRTYYATSEVSDGPFDRELSTTCAIASAVEAATTSHSHAQAAIWAARAVFRERGDIENGDDAVDPAETAAQRDLVRDIFGRPLRLEPPDRVWLTPTVLRLARAIYDDRDFTLMPILGDALEDAGCADEGVLSHLRSGGPHVRGCWVLDFLLGL